MTGSGHLLAPCGHGIEVSTGRCWDCHVAWLRSIGQGARADRLETLRRQIDEGRFALDMEGMAERVMAEYARDVGPDVPKPRAVRRMRDVGRPT